MVNQYLVIVLNGYRNGTLAWQNTRKDFIKDFIRKC